MLPLPESVRFSAASIPSSSTAFARPPPKLALVLRFLDSVRFVCDLLRDAERVEPPCTPRGAERFHRDVVQRWKTVLRDLKRRGMRPPVVAVGDGALGFWAAVRDVWPKTREQRDWFHKLGNILDKLPKRLQPRVKAALREMIYAETRE